MGTGANFKNRQYIFYPMLKRQAAGLRCRCSEEKKSCLRYLRRSFSPGTYSWGPCTSRLPGVHAASSRDNFSSANTCSGGKHTPPASGTTALCRAVPCHVLPKAAAGPPAPAPGLSERLAPCSHQVTANPPPGGISQRRSRSGSGAEPAASPNACKSTGKRGGG